MRSSFNFLDTMRKLLSHYLRLSFSKDYRYEHQLKIGEAIWSRLEHQLPKVQDCKEKDAVRLQKFGEAMQKFLPKNRIALKIWLEKQIADLKHTSGTNEQHLHQTYVEHLEYLVKNFKDVSF